MSEFVCEVAPDEFGELTEVARLGEEIVRCWDCKHCGDDYVSGGRNFFCERFERRAYAMGYCAWGEKR